MKADGDTTAAATHEQKKNELQAKINNLTAAAAQAYRTAGDLSEFVGIVKPLFHEAAEVGANLASRPAAEDAEPATTPRRTRADLTPKEEPTTTTPEAPVSESPTTPTTEAPKPGQGTPRPLTDAKAAAKAAAEKL